MSKKDNSHKMPVIRALLIYTFTALTVVISSWVSGLRRFDLSLTISKYIALRPWTYAVYAVAAITMVILVVPYVFKLPAATMKKTVYLTVMGCVLGCALFPYNPSWSILTSQIHDFFAYTLFLGVTLSFIITLVQTGDRSRKRFAFMASMYALVFIVLYAFVKLKAFHSTILIWENILIYLLLAEMYGE